MEKIPGIVRLYGDNLFPNSENYDGVIFLELRNETGAFFAGALESVPEEDQSDTVFTIIFYVGDGRLIY